MTSLTRDIISFLLNDQILPLKYLILGQLHFEQIAEELAEYETCKNFSEIVQRIKNETPNIKLSFAAAFNLMNEAKILISKNPRMWLGYSAGSAAEKGHLAMFEYLVSQGADDYEIYIRTALSMDIWQLLNLWVTTVSTKRLSSKPPLKVVISTSSSLRLELLAIWKITIRCYV